MTREKIDTAERTFLEAVAARSAARRTPRDAWTERLLCIFSVAVIVVLAVGVLGYL